MTQKRTHIKFVNLLIFIVTFIVSGFVFNAGTISAATNTTPATPTVISYTMSKVILSQNSDGSYNSVVVIGCAPGSGDKYDMNTGKRCTYNTATTIIGCAPQSGDLYDANTGKRCLNDTSITTPKPVVESPNVSKDKEISVVAASPIIALKPSASASSVPTPIIAKNPVDKSIIAAKIDQLESSVSNKLVAGNTDDSLSGREKIANSLSASVAKASSTLHGPMSLWLILLIIIIVLGGAYGIYSLVENRENGTPKKGIDLKKSEPVVKPAEVIKPLTHEVKATSPEPTVAPVQPAHVNATPTTPHVQPIPAQSANTHTEQPKQEQLIK